MIPMKNIAQNFSRKSFSILVILLVSQFVWVVAASAADDEKQSSTHPHARRDGFYSGITTGALFYTAGDRSLFEDGWVVGFKAGYDFIKYVGVEGMFKFSAHDSRFGSPAQGTPFSFMVYQYIAQLKGHYPITSRLRIEFGAGGGAFDSHPNQKRTVGDGMRGMGYGEFGVQYFTRIRGLSIGLDPSVAGVQNLKGAVVQATGFVRYTF